MNQRNVEALKEVLGKVYDSQIKDDGYLDWQVTAERLAAAGVLVPSVLTNNEVVLALAEGESIWWHDGELEIHHEAFRVQLEKIARGET